MTTPKKVTLSELMNGDLERFQEWHRNKRNNIAWENADVTKLDIAPYIEKYNRENGWVKKHTCNKCGVEIDGLEPLQLCKKCLMKGVE